MSRASVFNIQIHSEGGVKHRVSTTSKTSIPVKDNTPKRPRITASPKEEIPNLIRKRLRLRIGRKANATFGPTQAEGDEFAVVLTSLDIGRETGAVGEVGA